MGVNATLNINGHLSDGAISTLNTFAILESCDMAIYNDLPTHRILIPNQPVLVLANKCQALDGTAIRIPNFVLGMNKLKFETPTYMAKSDALTTGRKGKRKREKNRRLL